MIVVEHRIELVTEVCSRVVALDCGRVVTEGRPEAVLADARVRSAYLGVEAQASIAADQRPAPHPPDECGHVPAHR